MWGQCRYVRLPLGADRFLHTSSGFTSADRRRPRAHAGEHTHYFLVSKGFNRLFSQASNFIFSCKYTTTTSFSRDYQEIFHYICLNPNWLMLNIPYSSQNVMHIHLFSYSYLTKWHITNFTYNKVHMRCPRLFFWTTNHSALDLNITNEIFNVTWRDMKIKSLGSLLKCTIFFRVSLFFFFFLIFLLSSTYFSISLLPSLPLPSPGWVFYEVLWRTPIT